MKKLYAIIFVAVIASAAKQSHAQNTWTQKANYGGGAKQYAYAISIGAKGYFGLGNNTGYTTWYNDFWEWDPGTNIWTQKATFPGAARGNLAGFAIGTKGYIGTGSYALNASTWISYNDFWEYDPSGNTWTPKAAFPGAPRYDAVGFAIGAKGYIGTGYDASVNYSDFYEYDPGTDTWTPKAAFAGGTRRNAVGFSIGTKGYIGTGFPSSNDFWEYDPSGNTWTAKAPFGGTARYGAVGFAFGGKGYIGTGNDASGKTNDFWEWDPMTNVWTARASFAGTARVYAAGFSIGSKGYIGTGQDGSPYVSDYWQYSAINDAVNEINLDNYFSVSPNPTSGVFELRIADCQNCGLKIYNTLGEIVHQSEIHTPQSKIDLSASPGGVYFLQLTTDKGIARKKIVISK